MSVTLFEARRPSVAVMLCSSYGGLQPGPTHFEDWTTGTLYSETLMRLETGVWDEIDTLARIRLGLRSDEHGAPLGRDVTGGKVEQIVHGRIRHGIIAM